MRKNAALEASNVAVLLEHIPVGQTRSVHSLQVTRVEPDHYSIGGGRVIDLADAISQIGQYTGHGAPMRSNPTTKQHIEFAQDCLDLAIRLEASAGARNDPDELWRAYDEVNKGIGHIEGLVYTMTEAKTPAEALALMQKCEMLRSKIYDKIQEETYRRARAEITGRPAYYDLPTGQGGKVSNPWDQPRAEAKIAELQRMQRLQEKRESKKLSSDPEAKSARAEARAAAKHERLMKKSPELAKQMEKLRKARDLMENPQKAERGYFYEVLDKRGDVVMLTTTKAEAQDICANPAEYKLRKGGTFTFRHIGAQSALEGPPIRRI